jgi:hypothetical protein
MIDRHWAHLLAGGFVLACMATGAVLGVIASLFVQLLEREA